METKPFMNNCLIEVVLEDDGVSRTVENETRNRGVLIDYSVFGYHLTASAAIRFDDEERQAIVTKLEGMVGKHVRWEEFAEGGQTFELEGNTYALVPWWRVISFEEEN